MEVRPGYKLTEVGVIPRDWEVKHLRDFATIATGSTPPTANAANYGDEFLFVGPVDMGSTKQITHTAKRLSKKGFSIARRFPKDSILFVCIGSTIGKCGMASTDLTSNQQINAIFPSETFSSDFLYYGVSAAAPRVTALAGEQAVPLVNKSQFSETQVALPPLPEQRAIAAALSDVDALLGGLERLIAKKRDLKKAAMQQLLTGQTHLSGYSGEWGVKRLGDVLSRLANGALYQPSNSSGLPVTRIETIADGTIDMSRVGYGTQTSELEEYRMQSGDILFSHINSIDHIGKVALYSGEPPLYHGMNLLLLRAGRSLDSRFLFYWLGSHDGRRKAVTLARQAVSQASINTSDLKRVEIPFPPLSEQTAIAAVLSDMDAELSALEARRDKTRALKQAMMQELLTGRTRLV